MNRNPWTRILAGAMLAIFWWCWPVTLVACAVLAYLAWPWLNPAPTVLYRTVLPEKAAQQAKASPQECRPVLTDERRAELRRPKLSKPAIVVKEAQPKPQACEAVVSALLALGHKKAEAKNLAMKFSGRGSVEETISAIYRFQSTPAEASGRSA